MDDNNDVVIKAGVFSLYLDGHQFFIKNPVFRPFFNGFKDSIYDQQANDGKGGIVGETVIVKDWSEEMIDTFGTLRCGKLSKKKLDELKKSGGNFEAQVARNHKVKTQRLVFGLVSAPNGAQDKDGNPVELPKEKFTIERDGKVFELTGIPCFMTLGGNNFMPFDEEVAEPLNKVSRLMSMFELEMSTTRHVSEVNGKSYYVAHFKLDMTAPVQMTEGDIAVLQSIIEFVQHHNATVRKKYDAVLTKESKGAVPDELQGELASDLANDFYSDPVDDL